LRPFANVTDPAIGPFDQVICPFFLLAPLVADKPQWRDAPFFTLAIVTNALLYGFVAWKVVGIVRTKADPGKSS